ncbi:MAG: hypothetical protein ABIQ30_07655 [Devosia sp.]
MLTGLVVALIVLGAIYGYVAIRPVPPIDADFGPDKQSFSVPMPADEVFKVVEGLPVSAAKYKLGRADATKRRVILHDGMGMKSYGNFYPIDVTPTASGSDVTVGIKSKYPLQFGPFVRKQRDAQLAAIVSDVKAKLAGTI